MEPVAAAAAANWHTPQPIVEVLTFEDERVNRYVWYAGEDLPWPEIKGGWIKRCRVTPITPFLIWERINDVPEDMRKAVRKDWMDRQHQEALYEIRPAGIFNSIMEQYGALGVCELTALSGKTPQEVAALNLDSIFCPWDEIPKPYSVIEAHIRPLVRTLYEQRVLWNVANDMLKSLSVSRAYDEQFVDYEESQKELKYTRPGLRALSRLDRRRRDHALTDIAAADLAAKNAAAQASNDNSALVAEMAEQNRLKREELELRREELELNRQMVAKGKPGRRRSLARKPEQVNAE